MYKYYKLSLNNMKQDPFDTGRIKKIVGKTIEEHPLVRAFKLHQMVEELRGKRVQSTENVKKMVGAKPFS
jgi:mRNA-degrading endonuclease YafQ of YafQ-DinJ toxin-antitoxin module